MYPRDMEPLLSWMLMEIQFDSYEKYESLAIPSFWLGLVLYDMYHVVHNHFDSIYGGPGGSYEKVEQMTVDLLLSCVSNNVETIEEYDRMVGIEIPDNLKQNLIKSPIVLLNISLMLW